MATESAPMRVYGSRISYFTGKLEAYLRFKEIPYVLQPMTSEWFNRTVPEKTGAQQMPAVELPDGRWMTDTTPMISWLERQYPAHSVLPDDPVQAYVCRLIEDYADEWLWRPAMHYRWSHFLDRQLLGTFIVDELFAGLPVPAALKRWKIRRRQKTNFVDRDGVAKATRPHVERAYLYLLEMLEPVFRRRPFLLGERPTLADMGLFGPMFRHFSMDPTPAAIMRETAPACFEWVARMWNARGSTCQGPLEEGIPEDLMPLLTEIGETHLTNLAANALAWKAGGRTYAPEIQSTTYRNVPVSRYRVWCLEQLQFAYQSLEDETAFALQELLKAQRCWEPLWRLTDTDSGHDSQCDAPFCRGLKVYDVKGA